SYGKIMFETDMTIYYVSDYDKNPLLKLIDLIERVSSVSGISISDLTSMQASVYNEDYRVCNIPF
ncbi:MAG: hypothetical protein U1C33_00415, partial [Candidatus Cloacimonadaceae bacterium]|nr:hypothetical protein [Candidatus Cloacimonadaceae bacterium]